ncbi:uncharacterized protein LOC141588345 [Silene latifolia]|uniref:uncharacterized protein LOC141588345 n=1 Tax=Silene latifolia TaxID=37657 RepID=UPI003D76F616
MGGRVDNAINKGGAPYCFRLGGQNNHNIGSLLPPLGKQPWFMQLYFHDTDNELTNRVTSLNGEGKNSLQPEIVEGLSQMMYEHNEIAKVCKMARERMENEDLEHVQLRLRTAHSKDDQQFNLPTVNEFATLIIGNGDTEKGARDIVIQERVRGLQRISELHPKFTAMQYPLMFPYGEDGYRLGIEHSDAATTSKKKRKTVTMREYYSYRFQERWKNGKLINGICVLCGRNLFQLYEDGLAICRWAGPPDLFIDFTCNPKWDEISKFLKAIPGQRPEDRPDILGRVFKIKLDELIVDLTKRALFGETLADKAQDPTGYKAVVQFMLHGPCGEAKTNSPYMVDGKCLKYYPRDFCSHTSVSDDGYPVYRRRKHGKEAEKNDHTLDNRFVVPHNIDLLVKYQAHLMWNGVTNIGQSNTYSSTFPKGRIWHTQACMKYVSASEACWRVFAFEIQFKQPPVQRLSYHLESKQDIFFEDSEAPDDVLERVGDAKTTLTEWMATNQKHEDARSLTYAEFPTEWVWDNNGKVWTRRKKGFKIGRIYFANPNSGEPYYLRLLLNIVKGQNVLQISALWTKLFTLHISQLAMLLAY